MNLQEANIVLDSLVSKSNGDTLYFYLTTCPKPLLKEAILRGLQIYCLDNVVTEDGLIGEGYPFFQSELKDLYSWGVDLGQENFGWGEGEGSGIFLVPTMRQSGNGYGCGYGQVTWQENSFESFGEKGERELTNEGMRRNLFSKYQWIQSFPIFSHEPLNLKSLGIPLQMEEYYIR